MKFTMKSIAGFFAILALAGGILTAGNEQTVPVDGEQLYNAMRNAQKQNAATESMLIDALSKLHLKDVIRIVPVNSKGETGASVQPDLEIKGNQTTLTLGAILEFDLGKYNTLIAAPMREVLKQASTNGGEQITARNGQYKAIVNDYTWEYGSVAFKKVTENYERLSDAKKLQIVLNVLPKASNIFESKYEAYEVKLTETLEKALLGKIVEGNFFTVHFVFKDDAGQEIFHEECVGMRNGMHSLPLNDVMVNVKGARFEAEYALFIPYTGKTGNYLPLLISPEILGPNGPNDGRDKQLVTCEFKADSAEIQRIKSFEIYIEEAEIKK